MYIKCKSATEAFECILDELKVHGELSSPRGMLIKEVINCCIEIENPRDRIIQTPERKFGVAYAFGELLWYLSGRNDLGTMQYYSKNMEKFSDDGKTLNSAYGYRIFGHNAKIGFDQWEHVKYQLMVDPDCRQAIIHLHTPNKKKTKDEVCTLSLQFLIRKGKLNMITNMRSNDVMLGFTYDVFAFTTLQEILANDLGVEVGTYYHNAGSMHIYEQHFNMLNRPSGRTKSFPMEVNPMCLCDYNNLIDFEKYARCSDSNTIRMYSKNLCSCKSHSSYDTFVRVALLLKAIQKKDGFNIEKLMVANMLLNYLREMNEGYADILANRCSLFGQDNIKIVVEGIDGSGKTTLVDELMRSKVSSCAPNVQHYCKPSENFHYTNDYVKHIDSNLNVIFDRFFYSESVYSNVMHRQSKLSYVDEEILQMHLLRKGALFIFFAFDFDGVSTIYDRLSSADKGQFVIDNMLDMNMTYKAIALDLIRLGANVIIVDDPNYDVDELKKVIYRRLNI